MKRTGDLNLVKQMNKSVVLDSVRQHSPVSRADIAKLTGLTKATVSNLAAELIDGSFVQEIGTGQSSGGRKPVLLTFNARAGYAVGVDLGVNDIFAALTDLSGNVVAECRRGHDNASPDAVQSVLSDCIRELIGFAPASPYGIVGIGIGIPGICDGDGRIVFAPNLGWGNVPLRQRFEQEFSIPVVIENEANAGAAGEKQYGAGKDAAHMLYVSLGIGIGAGMVIHGELYRGFSGSAGEIGHMTIRHDGERCRCGNYGCWELYASEKALLDGAASLGLGENTGVERLLELADAGNRQAAALFDHLGRMIGIGIVSIVNGLNPERIIVGGRLVTAGSRLLQPILETVAERSLPAQGAVRSIQFSGLGIRSTVLGACSLAIRHFFAASAL